MTSLFRCKEWRACRVLRIAVVDVSNISCDNVLMDAGEWSPYVNRLRRKNTKAFFSAKDKSDVVYHGSEPLETFIFSSSGFSRIRKGSRGGKNMKKVNTSRNLGQLPSHRLVTAWWSHPPFFLSLSSFPLFRGNFEVRAFPLPVHLSPSNLAVSCNFGQLS